MVTDGRWWGRAHSLMMKAQSISPSHIAEHAWSSRLTAEKVDQSATPDNVTALGRQLEQLEAAVGTYRSQWVAYQYDVERLRRDLEVYARTLTDLPEVPVPPAASEQLLDDVNRTINLLTAEAQRKAKR